MGRELKRVPLDFDWPIRKVWEGYINPHWKPCPADNVDCFGGATAAGKWLDAVTRFIALLGEESLANTPESLAHFQRVGRIYPHPYLEEWSQAPRREIPREAHQRIRAIENERERFAELRRHLSAHPLKLLPLTAELAELVQGLCGKNPPPLGCSSSGWAIQKQIRKLARVGEDWGVCGVCGGEGIDPAAKEVYEAWQRTGPPTGEGWQLWETVTEGSPVSPVFATEEKFVRYLVDEGYSEKAARAFAKSGWAPSGGFLVSEDGVQAFPDIESAAMP